MTTLLFGSVRNVDETLQMPIHAPASRGAAGEDQVSFATTEEMPAQPPPAPRWDSALPSIPPVMRPARAFPALPAMTTGLVSTAAVWMGLALFLIAAAFPLSDAARVSLTLLGSSMIAAVIAFALSERPEFA